MRSFDSEAAMRQWLARIETRLDITTESVDELKEHLLDSIHELHTLGLDEEEAFLIASRRIGEPEALHVEFAKVEKGARAFDLGIAVVIILLFVPALTTLVAQVMFWISIAASLDLNDWLSWRGLTICAAADLLVLWAVVRLRGARWRSGFDWFRRAALPAQVGIVLAAMIPSLAVWGSHLLASHMASLSTLGAATFATSVFTMSIRIVVIPALAIWLLVRLKRTGARVAYTQENLRACPRQHRTPCGLPQGRLSRFKTTSRMSNVNRGHSRRAESTTPGAPRPPTRTNVARPRRGYCRCNHLTEPPENPGRFRSLATDRTGMAKWQLTRRNRVLG